jgi:hypothetical protein
MKSILVFLTVVFMFFMVTPVFAQQTAGNTVPVIKSTTPAVVPVVKKTKVKKVKKVKKPVTKPVVADPTAAPVPAGK